MVVVSFMDMQSGGGQKTKYSNIFFDFGNIKYDEEELEQQAIKLFEQKFNRDPHYVTCDCCGSDFSLSIREGNIFQATGFYRGCEYDENRYTNKPMLYKWWQEWYDEPQYAKYIPLHEYLAKPEIGYFKVKTKPVMKYDFSLE